MGEFQKVSRNAERALRGKKGGDTKTLCKRASLMMTSEGISLRSRVQEKGSTAQRGGSNKKERPYKANEGYRGSFC